MNEEYVKNRKILFITIAVAIIVITLAIIILVGIWRPKDNNIKNNNIQDVNISSNLGEFVTVTFTEDEQIKIYGRELITYLYNSKVDPLYDILNPQYVEYFNMDKPKFEKLLKDKKLLGTQLKVNSYVKHSFENRVAYEFKLTNANSTVSESIILIENSPNDYILAFDEFLFYDKTKLENANNSLTLTLYDRVGFISSYMMKAKLKNTAEDEIVLNNSHSYEPFYLNFVGGTELRTNTTVLSGEVIKMKKGQELSFELGFATNNFPYESIQNYIVKDITITKNNTNSNYDFKFNK